jgi:type IV secretory pathway VirB2 component (pilin)
MNLIKSFLQFVTIIAVVYVLWAGFQILTAGGDEEKVKTGRKIVIQVIIGIVVMWLAYAVVSWVIGALV